MSRLEDLVRASVRAARLDLRNEPAPAWLNRPVRDGHEAVWSAVERMYDVLGEGRQLPETIPGDRRPDNVLVIRGIRHLFEIDGGQHINVHRATTLELYPHLTQIGFPIAEWLERSRRKQPRMWGGWARPCPPLFPMPGGRHRERAFRDALTDLLPPLHGYGPTIRIADFEVRRWIDRGDAAIQIRRMIEERAVTPASA